jgi:hypothetical protein
MLELGVSDQELGDDWEVLGLCDHEACCVAIVESQVQNASCGNSGVGSKGLMV